MTAQYTLAIAAIAFATAIFVYIRIVWRKAPKASQAMTWIAAASLATGISMGFIADRLLRQWVDGSLASIDTHANPCLPDGFPATDIGKAIVLTNQQHAGDPEWIDPMGLASICPSETYAKDNSVCEAYFLASHALGLNVTKGDTRKCIPNEEVAELCTGSDIAKDSSVCKQAFDFQRKKLNP